jgi:hypothetical protein
MTFDFERVKKLSQQPDLEQALYYQDLLEAFTAGVELGYQQGIDAMEKQMVQTQMLLLRTGGSA